LNSSIGNLANLRTIELLPLLLIELHIERRNGHRINEIDEKVSNIALVLEINWQVEEVKKSSMAFTNSIENHLLSISVGDVLDHQSCQHVLTRQNFGNIQFELTEINLLLVGLTSHPISVTMRSFVEDWLFRLLGLLPASLCFSSVLAP